MNKLVIEIPVEEKEIAEEVRKTFPDCDEYEINSSGFESFLQFSVEITTALAGFSYIIKKWLENKRVDIEAVDKNGNQLKLKGTSKEIDKVLNNLGICEENN